MDFFCSFFLKKSANFATSKIYYALSTTKIITKTYIFSLCHKTTI